MNRNLDHQQAVREASNAQATAYAHERRAAARGDVRAMLAARENVRAATRRLATLTRHPTRQGATT